MIQITKKPYLCSFTKNSIEFSVTTDLQYESAVVFPELVLSFKNKPANGATFAISFTNAETGKRETVNFVAVDGSSAINYQNKWQIPDTSFPGSLAELRTIVYEKLKQFQIFNALYNIQLPIVEFIGSVPKITITAKEAIEELVMDWNSNQPTAEIDKYISEANSVAYYQPGVRDGYALKASLFVESYYDSGQFLFVTAIDCVLDENSIAHVDVAKYIDAEIEASWTEYPLPYEQELGYKAPNLRRYYVEFAESFANESEVFKVETEILYAHWGGASSDDAYNLNPIASQNTSGQWLTWWPSGKRILKEQSDWLAWMNGAIEKSITIELEFNQFGEIIKVPIHENILLKPFESFIFNSGWEANTGIGTDVSNWKFNVLQDNNGESSIKIIFSYEGENYEVIVPKTGVVAGKPYYQIGNYTIENYWQIAWTGTYWQLTTNFLGEFSTIFVNTTDSYFPIFEIWNFESGLNFIDLQSTSVVENIIQNEIRFYPLENCLAKQILFFNSFGIPESFLVSGEFQQNMTTSQELAVRTESFALDNKFPQNYIFDSKNVISYNAETLMLSNKEAERLMPLINSTITYLVEADRFIPVILNAGTTSIFKVNSFMQKIKLEMARANESDRVSYYEVLPDFEPILVGVGISICTLNRNLLNITDFGSIKIYKEGIEIEEFTYNSGQKYYSGTAITDEGLLTFELTCQINGIQKKVRKQINFAWNEIVYQFIYDGNTDRPAFFSMESYLTATPLRIDWGNGTTEDETVTTTLANYTQTYSENGKRFIRIFKPWFGDLTTFKIFYAVNLFDFSKFTSLQDVEVSQCVAGTYYFTGLKQLRTVTIDGTTLHGLNIGYQKYLEVVYLFNTGISQDVFEAFIFELWQFRKAYQNEFIVWLTSDVVINDLAQSLISGTGIYAGDGLNTYGITVQYD